MVSVIERGIWFTGLAALYSYGIYKFYEARSSFDIKFHESVKRQANKYILEENDPNLKFIDTNNKLLFLLGVDNHKNILRNLTLIDRTLENFSPDCIVYEKKIA